ncbi:MAG: universal stress protein [Caldilineaceae bacterium]
MSNDVQETTESGRILVALDASPHSMTALRAAARLAAAMQAELQGLYVEDANLFKLCQTPFCREVSLLTARVRQLETQMMERQMRVMASEMRRTLARVAAELQVRWSFQVTRGGVEHELLAAAEQASLLSLGRTGWLAGRRLGSTTRAVMERTLRPLLILGTKEATTTSLTLIYNGSTSADRALALAVRLAQKAHYAPHVLIVAPETLGDSLRIQVVRAFDAAGLHATIALIKATDNLAAVLQRAADHSFVLPVEFSHLLPELEGPVLLTP